MLLSPGAVAPVSGLVPLMALRPSLVSRHPV
jgi:hypothetical protein